MRELTESDDARTDLSQHVRNARINQHRWNVAWLHARADEMNDPHARAVLNSAAFELGLHFPPALLVEARDA